jgi:hypothetical protein
MTTESPSPYLADLASASFACGAVGLVAGLIAGVLAARSASSIPRSEQIAYGGFLATGVTGIAGGLSALAGVVLGLIARRRLRLGWEYRGWEVWSGLLSGGVAVIPCFLLATYGFLVFMFRFTF